MANVLVVAEIAEGKLKSTTLSAITFARQLVAAAGGGFTILALGGAGTESAASELQTYGAAKVLISSDVSLDNYLAETFTPTVATVGAAFDVIVATASSFGKDLLPRVAARLDAGFASDCASVSYDGKALVFKRPMYAGNAYGYVTISTPQVVATCRQSEFEAATPSGGSSPTENVAFVSPTTNAAKRVTFVSKDEVKSGRPELGDAKIIVSGGRGFKERFFEVLEPLADTLGAAIGASRAACDAGYAPGDFQVGQTGKIVAPRLYFAVGISGAIQHVAGMKGSKTIVAINKDPDAPIFQIADYGLVADMFEAVPELVNALKARKG
jgi:electron transfer flavoprotein alpha subunit